MNDVKVRLLTVLMDDRKVGTLALGANHLVAFSYDDNWLASGYSISPFSLPLEKKVFVPQGYDPFEGLFGVFSDSLPDGWGRLLVDRLLRRRQVDPYSVSSLYRLAVVGETGMGALRYRPESTLETSASDFSLDELAEECALILRSDSSGNLDELFRLGGSSGGARPKIFYQIDGEPWIVKFPTTYDPPTIGRQEYEYSLCARKCGIDVPKTLLLPSSTCDGYFAVKRFDREQDKRIHMASVSALLETSHRIPNLDYEQLMQLTLILTKSKEQLLQLYRRMCFNVFAHNRDDHSRNFSYLCREGHWTLSPAYDLTYSNSIGGEHATTVHGNGRNPGMEDLLAVAKSHKIPRKTALQIAEEIREIVREEL